MLDYYDDDDTELTFLEPKLKTVKQELYSFIEEACKKPKTFSSTALVSFVSQAFLNYVTKMTEVITTPVKCFLDEDTHWDVF